MSDGTNGFWDTEEELKGTNCYSFDPLKTTQKIRSCERATEAQLLLESAVDLARRNERLKIWQGIQSMIKDGDLGGNGCDGNAQRNGIILSANYVFNLGI